jgi:S-adenosylmethionine:tRNA ribosyltransferase-isomerase
VVAIERFDYELPEELIAQEPAARRDASRLLVVDRSAGATTPTERRFRDLPALLRPGDLLVVNDARVDPVRLTARRASGGTVEILLLRPTGGAWEALVKPGRRVRPGERLLLTKGQSSARAGEVGSGMRRSHAGDARPARAKSTGVGGLDHDADGPGEAVLEVVGDAPGGRKLIALPAGIPVPAFLDRWGEMPLPPYIRRRHDDGRAALDRERYQTVYAAAAGAVAAPTAGLHFSEELLAELRRDGVGIASLTLRVGPGTFQPLRVEEVEAHSMESEEYVLPEACVAAIVATRRAGGRIVGVGTTVVRTLEHAARAAGDIGRAAGAGSADIFIYPGFEFRVIDAMLTNFHLPRSTPLLMVAALLGRERLLHAYEHAVARGFRFYSYGDAMLIL